MNRSRWSAILALAALLTFGPAARGQQVTPHLGYVYPAGGQQGTTFQATIGGQRLAGASKVYVSGPGVEATVVEYKRPLTQREFQQLRDKLQELLKQPKDAAVSKEIAEIRQKISTFNRKANPALAETVTLQITLAPDAEPGERELRLTATTGLSNPLVFRVGQLKEFQEKEITSAPSPKAKPNPKNGKAGKKVPPAKTSTDEPEATIMLPAIVNGQIMPGGIDRYRFRARKGQQVVVATSARELIPYLADAVPGWFQAAVAIYDARGNELAYDDHYRFHPDPVLACKIPENGEYVLEVKDALYRGREDFVYRIAVGELPFVTSVFPLGGRAGTQTTVKLEGWHLPQTTLTVDGKDQAPGILPVLVRGKKLDSNPVPFAVDALPECLEQEPNNEPASAQRVTLPVIVNGRVDAPGDADVFRFEGRAGEQVVAEVVARRLDSPLDSVLKLTDASGRQLAFNDDHEDKGSGLHTHHADSLLTATLPADGSYYVHLGDAQHQGGSAYGYRLRISAPRPDFELRVVPSSINARPGMCVPIMVYALRKDGFSGEIVLALKDAPEGFALSGARVPANQDQVRLTLTASSSAGEEPIRLRMEGRAAIQGREITRTAVPAEDMMQAFAYRHLVPAQELMIAVTGRGRGRASFQLLGKEPVKIPAGGTAAIRFSGPRGPMMDQVQLSLDEPPEGIAVDKSSASREGVTLVVRADAGKVKPGLKGNLIVDAFTERAAAAKAGKAAMNRQRVPLGTLPAIPFEIVEAVK